LRCRAPRCDNPVRSRVDGGSGDEAEAGREETAAIIGFVHEFESQRRDQYAATECHDRRNQTLRQIREIAEARSDQERQSSKEAPERGLYPERNGRKHEKSFL
jgi:hypothetical protein